VAQLVSPVPAAFRPTDETGLRPKTAEYPQAPVDFGPRMLKIANLQRAETECVERFLSMATTSTPISANERAKREQALVATVAHLRIEDLHLDNDLKRIFQRHVDGEIGAEELAAAIDELNERRFGPLPVSGNGRP
jgi:hypothetical protein